ncbi:MAG TPA: aminoglycoside phosphotransferase family protein, partial [Mycobacteriales bacterium]|nr:aminoglycoside phosphotransferase family protein [Mycobacteriales bacterium]
PGGRVGNATAAQPDGRAAPESQVPDPAPSFYAPPVTESAAGTASWRTRVRAIVLHPSRPEALVLPAPGGPALPEFELPDRAWTGRPQPFVQGVRDAVGFEVALLRSAGEQDDDDGLIRHTSAVFVARDECPALPDNARWLGGADAAGLADLAPVLGEIVAGRVPAERAPWRDRAWLGTAEEWMVTSLAALGRPVRGRVEQVRMAELSCVLKAATDDGDVYFKATLRLPLFANEGRVMAALAELFPADIPAPLAVDPERRWMLLPDLGPEVGWNAPIEVLEQVLRAFAGLQIRSVGSLDRLLAAGCLDRTPQWLARQATEWPATVDLSRWLSAGEAAELTAAATGLASACAALAGQPLPSTLGHGDMHLGNVARSGGGYLFFDWSDACVLHPFLDMITIFLDDDPAIRERLRDVYLAEWASFAPRDQLLAAWQLAEPLAALNQAISYVSIAAHLEPGPDRDGLIDETATWLRRLIDWHRQPAPAGAPPAPAAPSEPLATAP